MIKLEVEPYCHECDDFEPECNKLCACTIIGSFVVDQIVSCVNRTRCLKIHDRIKQTFEKEQKENATL